MTGPASPTSPRYLLMRSTVPAPGVDRRGDSRGRGTGPLVGRFLLQLLVLLLLAAAGVVRGEAPRPIRVDTHVRHVGLVEHDSDGRQVYDDYKVAAIDVRFDQPLMVNGSLPIEDLDLALPTSRRDALYGLVRMSCDDGSFLVDSHPPPVLGGGSASPADGLPRYLLPLSGGRHQMVDRLFPGFDLRQVFGLGDRFKPANELIYVLLLSVTRFGGAPEQTLFDERLLDTCELSWVEEDEQSWWVPVTVGNAGGEVVGATVRLNGTVVVDPVAARDEALERAAAAEAAGGRRTDPAPAPKAAEARKDNNEPLLNLTDSVTLETLLLEDPTSLLTTPSTITAAITEQAASSSSTVDTANVFSLLQVMHRVGTLESLEADQYFELIEDPLLNMVSAFALKGTGTVSTYGRLTIYGRSTGAGA